jgi:hypothetical protein
MNCIKSLSVRAHLLLFFRSIHHDSLTGFVAAVNQPF